jgi:vacuolar-type H+-ATPase subunit I/STV1
MAIALFIGWLVVQAFAWVLGVFSPNIHAARLHMVEWMKQYYDSSGKPFSPFGGTSRYVEGE